MIDNLATNDLPFEPADVTAAKLRKAPPKFAVKLALALRRVFLSLADRVIPAQFALFDHVVADGTARSLGTVARLGVADLLEAGPRTAQDMATELGVNADALHRLLRGLALREIFTLDKHGRFGLGPMGRRLTTQHPESMRAWTTYWGTRSNQESWDRLDDVVRTGRPAFPDRHGMSVWQWFDEHPAEGRMFASAMRRLTEFDSPDIVAIYPWPKRGTVCDLAGGAGTLLSRVLQNNEGLRGVLVEAPLVLAEAEKVFAERGVVERVDLIEGDIFGHVEATADMYLLKNVLHDWDDSACAQILRTVHAAMPKGAPLVVVELLQERDEPAYPASLTDLQMMVVCDGGRERSKSELHDLLKDAGFSPSKTYTSASGLGLVTATA